jgi:SAGA-associated factor 73
MAGDNNSRKSTPGTTSGTIKLKKTKSKLDPTASRANSPAFSVAGDSITVKSRAFSPDTPTTSAPVVDETNKLCKHCKKHYDATVEPNHSRLCLRAKQERQRKKREEKERAERAAAGEDVNMEDSTADTPLRGVSVVSTATAKIDTPDQAKAKKAAATTTAAATDKKQTKKRKATDTDTGSAAGDPSEKGSMKPPTKKQKKAAAFAAAAERRAESASLRGTPAPGLAAATKVSVAKEKAPPDPLALTTPTTNTSTSSAKEKASQAKAKAPVDVERQCGVPLANGQMCARSLTCKSHAMGAKRAVPGRSLPYDILLNQYQKKNQAKLQKQVMERNAAEEREREGLEGGDGEGGRVDSEEEVERVLGGLGRWNPKPVVEWGAFAAAGDGAGTYGGVQRRTKEVRIKEALAEALKGTRGGNLFGVPARAPDGAAGIGMGMMPPGVADGTDMNMAGQQGMMTSDAMMGPPPPSLMMGTVDAEAARRMSVQAAQHRRASQQAQQAGLQGNQQGQQQQTVLSVP